MFLHVEMPWAKFFWRPYLCKISVLMEQAITDSGFLLCFSGVFSSCRNVFAITFLRVKTKIGV
jgi:hypothetical protein